MDDQQIIAAFNAHYRQRGLDPAKFPVLSKRYTKEELEERLSFYKEYIDIILFFVNKFLSTIQGTPILVTVTDQWGYLLECYGEPMFSRGHRGAGHYQGGPLQRGNRHGLSSAVPAV